MKCYILGKVNVGKSTFINSMIGSEVAQTGVRSLTDNFNEYYYNDNMTFIDTPGINHEGQTITIFEKLENNLKSDDTIIFLFDKDGLECVFYKQLIEQIYQLIFNKLNPPNFIFILNKLDEINDDNDLQQIKENLTQRLNTIINDEVLGLELKIPIKIFTYSSKNVLKLKTLDNFNEQNLFSFKHYILGIIGIIQHFNNIPFSEQNYQNLNDKDYLIKLYDDILTSEELFFKTLSDKIGVYSFNQFTNSHEFRQTLKIKNLLSHDIFKINLVSLKNFSEIELRELKQKYFQIIDLIGNENFNNFIKLKIKQIIDDKVSILLYNISFNKNNNKLTINEKIRLIFHSYIYFLILNKLLKKLTNNEIHLYNLSDFVGGSFYSLLNTNKELVINYLNFIITEFPDIIIKNNSFLYLLIKQILTNQLLFENNSLTEKLKNIIKFLDSEKVLAVIDEILEKQYNLFKKDQNKLSLKIILQCLDIRKNIYLHLDLNTENIVNYLVNIMVNDYDNFDKNNYHIVKLILDDYYKYTKFTKNIIKQRLHNSVIKIEEIITKLNNEDFINKIRNHFIGTGSSISIFTLIGEIFGISQISLSTGGITLIVGGICIGFEVYKKIDRDLEIKKLNNIKNILNNYIFKIDSSFA